jgi:hypothetical protein
MPAPTPGAEAAAQIQNASDERATPPKKTVAPAVIIPVNRPAEIKPTIRNNQ